jgi:thioredoxin 1
MISFDQASSRDEEYKQKVEHLVEPVVITFLSPLDDKCKAVASKIEGPSDEFPTTKFYQVDVTKHGMLSRALSNTELPIVVFVKNGTDFLTLTSDVSLPGHREGLQAPLTASC